MDIYSEVTSRIISEMEQGVIPWQKPWVASGGCISYATGKPYSLLNQMLLGKPGEYTDNQAYHDSDDDHHFDFAPKIHLTPPSPD